ncbi:MAG: hypothetical protein KVP17_001641 [Porospora cf. gigantea B]|uniref:uncharacterized protein n=1 Tax=Porospora cf. gigantea B TaxID=2853592 RepID=UPI003571C7EA|nr:MAG: hypothetical protein KVP17_001641 [Porospora cf. gigantea B]
MGDSTNNAVKKLQYHRTKMCPWFDAKRCFMGDRCNYAHSIEELRPKPDLSKTRLCVKALTGEVCHDSECRYAHEFHELQATDAFFKTKLCKFWQTGFCPSGVACRHAHGEEELRGVDKSSMGSTTPSPLSTPRTPHTPSRRVDDGVLRPPKLCEVPQLSPAQEGYYQLPAYHARCFVVGLIRVGTSFEELCNPRAVWSASFHHLVQVLALKDIFKEYESVEAIGYENSILRTLMRYEQINLLERIPTMQLPHPTLTQIAKSPDSDIVKWLIVARILSELAGYGTKFDHRTLSVICSYILKKGGCSDVELPVDLVPPETTLLMDSLLGSRLN